jgi:hypothetical protein
VTRGGRLESRVSTRAVAAFLTVGMHAGFLALVALSGGRRDGLHDDDTPVTQLVFVESVVAGGHDGHEWTPRPPPLAAPRQVEPPDVETTEPPAPPIVVAVLHDPARERTRVEVEPLGEVALARIVEPPANVVLPAAEAASLVEHLERVARELATTERTRVTWEQDGRTYDAELVRAPAADDVEPDRVVAEVSAEDQGRQLTTRLMLRRLPFTHFAQFVDRWDPMVEMHDDAIEGRMHINSWFKLLHDAQAQPAFHGRVSTASAGFQLRALGGPRQGGVFREGVETNAGRIALSVQAPLLEQARRDRSAHLHELADDTRITFAADGSYELCEGRSAPVRFAARPAGQSVYLVAGRDAAVSVQGVVAGRFLVYSPRRIVVAGNLVYARDPRADRDSGDYLGLVSDRDIVVAPPHVTGPGDLQIHAALYARRRLVVAGFEHPRPATLRIFGSLAAGTLAASEPRYATQIDYDWRFERLRPPGFPSTDRYAAEEWDGTWTVVSERSGAANL